MAIVDGESIEKLADDDPPDTQGDFSVKETYNTAKKKVEVIEQWAVVSRKGAARIKKRSEGGRAFVTKSVGGLATLRITAT